MNVEAFLCILRAYFFYFLNLENGLFQTHPPTKSGKFQIFFSFWTLPLFHIQSDKYFQVQKVLLEKMKSILFEWYGSNPQKSDNLCRIVNDRNWQRLNNLLQGSKGKIVLGGDLDQSDLYISPTVLTDVTQEDSLMQEEIFGPILPMMSVSNAQESELLQMLRILKINFLSSQILTFLAI